MKRIISLLLALVIMISTTTTSFAANTGEEYYTVQVEYSDNIGHQERLDVMILNNNVFVDAKMLAERLGYTFGENGAGVVIYNKDTSNGLPLGITQFKYNSTQVSHMLFNNMIDTYEASFASVKNSKGSWIPLEYSLLLINSGMMITEDVLLIDIPTKRIIDYFYDIAKNSEKYNFDWADDFGYTATDIKVLGGSSHLVNVFNGLLGFDGASWATLFQQFAGSMASYDKKYGENLAMLLCTESDKELQASIEKVKLLNDLLNEDGDLGELLSFTSDMADFEVGTLYRQCEAVLEGIKTGNSSAVDYSRSYQALENALDRQTWFSHTGGNILEVQKSVSSATGKAFKFLEVGMKVAEVVGYAQEFQNQDKFSLAALTYYLDNENGGLELPKVMKRSMIDYSKALSSSIGEYTTKRFAENFDQWIIDEIPMHEVLGTQAAAVLFAWNIASNTIPFIANGLSGADSFELALYSLVFQGDTYLNYLGKRDSIFADSENITAENVYDIAQYCYIYLKSCYITREVALASLVNKTNSTKEKIQPLIDYQNSINAEIAKIMVELKGANKTNEGCVFGFLPLNNDKYLSKYDDSQLIQWIETFKSKIQSSSMNEPLSLTQDERYSFNIFLSNFSEQWFNESYMWDEQNNDYIIVSDKFESQNANPMELVKFACLYLKLNSNTVEFLTYNDYSYGGFSIDSINAVTQRFFGRSVSLEEIVPIQLFDDYYDYIVIDDMVCLAWGDGETYNNMTIVKDIYNLGDGMMQVEFNIYSIDINYNNLVDIGGGIKDKNVYYYTQTDAEMHPAFKFYLSGIAIINPDTLSEGKKYQLISYELISEDVACERIEIMDYYALNTYEFADLFGMRISEGPGGCNGFGSGEHLYRRGEWDNYYSISLHASTELVNTVGGFQTSIISEKYSIYGAYVGMSYDECIDILEKHDFILSESETWNVDQSYYYYFYNNEGARVQINIYENICDGIDYWPEIYFH